MARNSLGRFTARRRVTRAGLAQRFVGRAVPIEGVEVDGVVSGEPIVFAPEVEPQQAERKAAKASS